MIAFDLIITESSICLRDFSGIYEAQVTDAFQTLGNILQFEIVYKELSTLSCRVSYMPRLAKVVYNFILAIVYGKLNKELKLLGFVEALLCTRVNMIALDLTI